MAINPIIPTLVNTATTAGASILPNITLPPIPLQTNQLGIFVAGPAANLAKEFIAKQAIAFNEELGKKMVAKNLEPLKSGIQIKERQGAFSDRTVKGEYAFNEKSIFGNFVFDNFVFYAGQYQTYVINNNGEVQKGDVIEYEQLTMNTCLVNVQRSKNIVQTIPVSANVGSVKEIVSTNEYTINVRGFITNGDNPLNYNQEAIRLFRTIMESTEELLVGSYFCQMLGIDRVVISDYSMEQVQGMSGVVQFQINMISDTIIPYNTSVITPSPTTNQFQNPQQ
jgi:hypothetical protein